MAAMAAPVRATERAPRWTRLEHDERRQQILSCARRLFSERSYDTVSTTEIAREAGITRGLLHHYFGTKRDLYLEVVRSLAELPPGVLEGEAVSGRDRDEVLAEAVDRYLEVARRNRRTWLATAGAQGFGRDPEVEAIVERAREQIADRLIALLGRDPANASPELRALIGAYAGFAQAATVEWLQRRRLSQEQVRELLLGSLLQLVREVLPRIERAGEH
jgi:AcrR family transcriptional regulator